MQLLAEITKLREKYGPGEIKTTTDYTIPEQTVRSEVTEDVKTQQPRVVSPVKTSPVKNRLASISIDEQKSPSHDPTAIPFVGPISLSKNSAVKGTSMPQPIKPERVIIQSEEK